MSSNLATATGAVTGVVGAVIPLFALGYTLNFLERTIGNTQSQLPDYRRKKSKQKQPPSLYGGYGNYDNYDNYDNYNDYGNYGNYGNYGSKKKKSSSIDADSIFDMESFF